MAENAKFSVENQLRCSFMSVIFQNHFFGQRKSTQKSFLEKTENGSCNLKSTHNQQVNKPLQKINRKPSPNHNSVSSKVLNQTNRSKRPSDSSRTSTSSSSNSSRALNPRKTIITYAKSIKPLDLDKNNGKALVTTNIVRNNSGEIISQFGNIYGRLTTNKMDPEVVKCMGNEKYKQGRFDEALAFYNRAISLDPNKATYYSNKGAALIGLGRLVEAVFECRHAVSIEPRYHRAHHRLATIYLRLGEAEKALENFKLAGLKDTSNEIAKTRALGRHLIACAKHVDLKDWNSLLKESQNAITLGVDSAPEVHAMKVNALLNVHKHKEAYEAFEKWPHFDDIDSCIRLFGGATCAYVLTVQAQVLMVVGRFEDALEAAHQAARLDKSHKTNTSIKRVEAIALARSNGNQLFNVSKFLEAYVIYSEGLKLDPFNSVLLCNRAACRFKLGQFEKAVEDCDIALSVRPCYSKARLRRANSYAKLEKWEAAIQDYEILFRETPRDHELAKSLLEARAQLNRQHSEDIVELRLTKC